MMSRRVAWSCAAWLLIVVTSSSRAQTTALPSQPSPPPVTLTQLTLSLARSISVGTTFGAWRVAHATDSVSLLGEDGDFVPQCVNTRRLISLAGGDTVHMTAYFYPPPTPAYAVLPVGIPPQRLRDACQAGAAQLWLRDTNGVRMREYRIGLESGLDAALKQVGKARGGSSAGAGDSNRIYRGNDSLVVSTKAGSGRTTDGRVAMTMHGLSVAMVARRAHLDLLGELWPRPPSAAARLSGDYRNELDAADSPATARAVAAFRLASIGGAAERNLRALFDRLQRESREPTPDAAALIPALAEWMQRTVRLPPARRSAALFVADAVLDRWMRTLLPIVGGQIPFDDRGSVLHDRLAAVGASIAILSDQYKDETFRWYSYTRNWLKQAYQIAPDSRAGGFAFLALAEAGFRTSPACAPMAETVIARGSEYLRRYPRSPIGDQVHLLIAEAWSDMLSSAWAGLAADGNPLRLRPRGEDTLRAHAIAEFTVGLRGHPGGAQARVAWEGAWRLMAGLAPSREYFFCESE